MDVVVVGAKVIRIARQHRLEHGHDLFGALRGLAVERPELPRVQVHQALGVERGGVEVVGVSARQIAHGVGVLARQRRAVRLGIGRKPDGHRLDVRALGLGPALRQRQRLRDGRVRLLRPVIVHIEVVVGTERPRDAPVRHRGLRIELGRALERADGFLVVEPEHQIKPLVEVALRLRARRRDGVVVVAHPRHERGSLGLGCRGRRRSRGLFGSGRAARSESHGRHEGGKRCAHRANVIP